jgi:hypothetical protein
VLISSTLRLGWCLISLLRPLLFSKCPSALLFQYLNMLLRTVFSLCYASIVQARPHLGRTAKVIDAKQISNETTYDFVIAGGGIAGLTVADRLTENPNGKPLSVSTNSLLISSNSYCTGYRVWPFRPERRRRHDPWRVLPSTVSLAAIDEYTTNCAWKHVVWCAMWESGGWRVCCQCNVLPSIGC